MSAGADVSGLDSAIAGATAGVVSRIASAPLDVLKIRFQLQVEPIKKSSSISKYRGIVHATRAILAEEGVHALWKGLTPGLLLYFMFGGIQFSCYDQIVNSLKKNCVFSSKTSRDIVGGSVAASTATVLCHPLDVLRTRFIAQGEPKHYSGLLSAIQLMHKENGLRTFYRGLTPALLLIIPQAGMHFGLYSFLTTAWNTMITRKNFQPLEGNANVGSFVCGTLAGLTSKTIMLPFDMVKKRLEIQGFEIARSPFGEVVQYSGVLDCFVKLWKKEGLLGFYKGAAPSIAKTGLTVGITFTTYEYVLGALKR